MLLRDFKLSKKSEMKKIISVIAFAGSAVIMAGCESQERAKEEENKALIRNEFEEAWNQEKLDVIDDIYTDDFIRHNFSSPDIHGPEGLKQSVSEFRTAFPDAQFRIDDQIAEGDIVVIRWTGSGTHKGELMGISPSGLQVTWTGISIYHFADGNIVGIWVNSGLLGLLLQLDSIPPIGQSESYLSFKAGKDNRLKLATDIQPNQ